MIFWVVLMSAVFLGAGYAFYGRRLGRMMRLDASAPTAACAVNDGVDFVPARAPLLFGQHFSAIAAAGPIVGPVLAGIWFGWAPTLAWILLGAVFVGGPHDFLSLIASVRNRGASMGDLARQTLSRHTKTLFLVFVWFALEYVIIAFTDITAQGFKAVSGGTTYGPAVAAGSALYLVIGLAMGLVLRKTRLPLWAATAVFLPLVFLSVWAGTRLPVSWAGALAAVPVKAWEAGLLAYCFAASIAPMWILLQPRGYLGGWFLYATMAVALLGALFGGYAVQYPAFHLEGLKSLVNGRAVFPALFITVACGACSGFHGIVSTGTTSKQVAREPDARTVGYGAMVLEGLVAVLALATVMMLAPDDASLRGDPNLVYANGLASYLGRIGVDPGLALTFALLAFATFVYDTLDVATRLARYILQEMLDWRTRAGALAATALSLVLPLAFLLAAREKAYLAAWPIFGSSNQLLASLTLLILSVWLHRIGRDARVAAVPMALMAVFTLWSLVLQVRPFVSSLPRVLRGGTLPPDVWISGSVGLVLLLMAVWLMAEAGAVLAARRPVSAAA
jgi:carbon starvation protein